MNFLWSLLSKFRYWQYERRCMKHLGMKPTKMYVSKEAYDELVRRINEKPKFNQKIYDLMSKKSPWDEE
jgi:hypothetical protein